MSSYEKQEVESRIVDGQRVVFPTEEDWQRVQNGGLIEGRPVGVPEMLSDALVFVRQHSELRLGLVLPAATWSDWLPCVFIKIDDALHRGPR